MTNNTTETTTSTPELPRVGTYRTHYASHAPERVQILEAVSAGSLRVRFMSDGAEEIVPMSSVTGD